MRAILRLTGHTFAGLLALACVFALVAWPVSYYFPTEGHVSVLGCTGLFLIADGSLLLAFSIDAREPLHVRLLTRDAADAALEFVAVWEPWPTSRVGVLRTFNQWYGAIAPAPLFSLLFAVFPLLWYFKVRRIRSRGFPVEQLPPKL